MVFVMQLLSIIDLLPQCNFSLSFVIFHKIRLEAGWCGVWAVHDQSRGLSGNWNYSKFLCRYDFVPPNYWKHSIGLLIQLYLYIAFKVQCMHVTPSNTMIRHFLKRSFKKCSIMQPRHLRWRIVGFGLELELNWLQCQTTCISFCPDHLCSGN